MKKLEGKTVIVTGATSGIGEKQAYLFASEGANVVCVGRNPERMEKVLLHIKARGGSAIGCIAKVEKSDQCRKVIQRAMEKFGGMDILVNTAGVFDNLKKSLEISEEEWKYIFDVNVNGVFNMCNAALPYMISEGAGVILNTASISGLTAGPGGSAYIASKHAVVGYTKQLSLEYAEKGIRVNAVAPGSVMTPLLEKAMQNDPDGMERRLSFIPCGRLGTPEDIAKLSLFLVSEDSDWIHGAVISIDGGRFAKG